MKIVLYVNSFLPAIVGREVAVFHLARALKTLGHEVRVVGPAGWWRNRGLTYGFPVHRYPATFGFEVWHKYAQASASNVKVGLRGKLQEFVKQLQLLWDLKRWGCDVLHAHSTYPNGYNAARLRRFLKVPIVVTPHGEDINTVPAIGFGLRLNPLLEPRIRHAIQKADAVTAISESVSNALVDAGAPLNRVHRISNGVDVARFSERCEADISFLPFSTHGARLIISVGNYRQCKGHEVIIQAMPAILAVEPLARLIIVGRGTEVLKGLVKELDIERRVILTGAMDLPHPCETNHVSMDPLAALLRASELYVSASVGEGAEGLSLAVLEAIAAGLPVVATRISGNRDVIADGCNGKLVEPNNPDALAKAIIELLKDDVKRQSYALQAQSVASRFDWLAIASQYVALYEQVKVERARRNVVGTRKMHAT